MGCRHDTIYSAFCLTLSAYSSIVSVHGNTLLLLVALLSLTSKYSAYSRLVRTPHLTTTHLTKRPTPLRLVNIELTGEPLDESRRRPSYQSQHPQTYQPPFVRESLQRNRQQADLSIPRIRTISLPGKLAKVVDTYRTFRPLHKNSHLLLRQAAKIPSTCPVRLLPRCIYIEVETAPSLIKCNTDAPTRDNYRI